MISSSSENVRESLKKTYMGKAFQYGIVALNSKTATYNKKTSEIIFSWEVSENTQDSFCTELRANASFK